MQQELQRVLAETIVVRATTPPEDKAYRQFLVASLLLATLLGFVLGIHVHWRGCSISDALNAQQTW
jgi:hypothetical protein